MAKYLEQGDEIAPDQLHAPFEKALREGHLVPVCFTSARTGAGVEELLNVLVKLAPNPLEGNPPLFYKGRRRRRRGIPFRAGSEEARARARLQGRHRSVRRQARHLPRASGHDHARHAALHRRRPQAVQGRSPVHAAGREERRDRPRDSRRHRRGREGRRDRLRLRCCTTRTTKTRSTCGRSSSRGRCTASRSRRRSAATSSGSPTCCTRWSPRTRRWSSSRTRTTTRPCCARSATCTCARCWSGWRRSTSSRSTRARRASRIARRSPATPKSTYRHKKQTGGAGQFGEVCLRVEPLPRGGGFDFVDATKGGVIPHQFMPAVQKGVEQVLEHGAIAGFPMQDIRVTVFDGKHHPVDSKEIAFITAGRKAFLDAISKARPVVLEPIVTVEIVCPDVNTGDITGDLSSRRGQVTGTNGMGAGALAVTGSRAAGRARRLRRAPQVGDRRPRRVLDGAVALRAGAADAAAAAGCGVREASQARGGLTARSRTLLWRRWHGLELLKTKTAYVNPSDDLSAGPMSHSGR